MKLKPQFRGQLYSHLRRPLDDRLWYQLELGRQLRGLDGQADDQLWGQLWNRLIDIRSKVYQ